MKHTIRTLLLAGLILCLSMTCALAQTTEAEDFVFYEWGSYMVYGENIFFEETDPAIDLNRGNYSFGWDDLGMGGYTGYFVDVTLDPARVKVSGDYTYYLLDDGTAAILDIAKAHQTKTLKIPAQLDGITVSQLGYSMNLTVASAIEGEVYDADWMTSPNVEKVELPESVKVVCSHVFSESGIKQLDFPDSVEEIGSVLLEFNGKIGTLPKSLKKLGNLAFAATQFKNKSLKLNDGLLEIGEAAFMETNISSVVIPGSVTKIGRNAFTSAYNLSSATLKEGVPYVSPGMFAACEKLSKITIPASVTEIGAEAFRGCGKLATLSFAKKSTLKTIGQGAFRHCSSLKKAVIPEGVETIGADAFFDCSKLSAVTIPASVTEIGDYAFNGCASNLTITVAKDSYAQQWAEANGFKVKVQKGK